MIQAGDRVGYSKKFLQSIGCCTGSEPTRRGTVKEIYGPGATVRAKVQWDDEDRPLHNVPAVLLTNLWKVGTNSDA